MRKLTLELATELFHKSVKKDKNYKEVLEIVNSISNNAGLWLVGGTVYRGIVQELYGTKNPDMDFDFVIEKPSISMELPRDVDVRRNKFGNIKLVSPRYEMDLVPLHNVYAIKLNSAPATIENYMRFSPFNIHNIAYDVRKRQVIGKVGLKAIEDRVVSINDRYFAELRAKMNGVSLNELLQEKAVSLGFKAFSV